MKVLKFPHPNLFLKCKEVTVFDDSLKKNLTQMWNVMLEEKGIGLSANQVGLTDNMFVMSDINGQQINFINPKIVWSSRELSNIKEGCLSAPGEFLIIKSRSAIVKVEFQDESGEHRSRIFNDIWSVCVQHEIDHLLGKSFLQSKTISKEQRKELAKKWKLKN